MTNITKLAQQIKSGEYPREETDVEQFFNDDGSPIREKRIQVRDTDRDIDRIDRAVNKMLVSGDYSNLEDLTLVEFPTGEKVLEILLPKIKKQYPKKKNGNAKDPRIGVTVSQKEIKENGERIM